MLVIKIVDEKTPRTLLASEKYHFEHYPVCVNGKRSKITWVQNGILNFSNLIKNTITKYLM